MTTESSHSKQPLKIVRVKQISNDEFSPLDVVSRIESGDKGAESELVAFYSDKLRFILNQKFQDHQLCQDTHQEAFATVIKKIRQGHLREPSKLASFIRSTAVNLALMAIRKNYRTITASDSPMLNNLTQNTISARKKIEQHQLAKMVLTVINQLDVARDRTILISFYVTGLDKSQICQQLDITPNHFDKIIYRSKQRLKSIIMRHKTSALFSMVSQWIPKKNRGENHE